MIVVAGAYHSGHTTCPSNRLTDSDNAKTLSANTTHKRKASGGTAASCCVNSNLHFHSSLNMISSPVCSSNHLRTRTWRFWTEPLVRFWFLWRTGPYIPSLFGNDLGTIDDQFTSNWPINPYIIAGIQSKLLYIFTQLSNSQYCWNSIRLRIREIIILPCCIVK